MPAWWVLFPEAGAGACLALSGGVRMIEAGVGLFCCPDLGGGCLWLRKTVGGVLGGLFMGCWIS